MINRYDQEKDDLYNSLPTLVRLKLYDYVETIHGKPTTREKYWNLIDWSCDKGLHPCDISDKARNQIIKKWGDNVLLNIGKEVIE